MPPKDAKQPDWNIVEKRGYALMTDAEKWKYHTHVYAFRIVYLDAPETQHWWDGDLKGEFFDAEAIAAEVSRLLRKKERQDGSAHRRVHPDDPRDDPVVQAQRRAIVKLWGLPNWQACLDRMWADAVAHPNRDGQPDAVGAYRRSGIPEFCRAWGDRLVRNQMEARAKATAEQGLADAQRRAKQWWTAEDLP